LTAALTAAGVTEDVCAVFADEMRCGLMGSVRQVWAPQGMAVQQPLQMDRDNIYLHLAVESGTGRIWWRWEARMNAPAVVSTLAAWQDAGIAAIVWDNAPSHRAQVVRDLGLALIGLPAYSPELNPAERCFEELRRRCEGKTYASLAEKVAVVEEELQRWARCPELIQRLCHWEWIEEAMPTRQSSGLLAA